MKGTLMGIPGSLIRERTVLRNLVWGSAFEDLAEAQTSGPGLRGSELEISRLFPNRVFSV